jgi:hypothetical protein
MRIFIGYDSKQPAAFATLAHSIYTRASKPVSIIPLTLKSLEGIYTRTRTVLESTEFSFTRFLVPYLCGYGKDPALFMDCDMLCKVDIHTIMQDISEPRPVWCVQHDYRTGAGIKMIDQVQTPYEKKNWSSVMVFYPYMCQALTPTYVNSATGLQLHQFQWTPQKLGALPLEWNWLVGEYPKNDNAKILHYTLGGPWLHPYRDTDHAADWFNIHKEIC